LVEENIMDIQQKIKIILKEMDVNQDREDAEAKAIEIYRLGPDALNILINFAENYENSRQNGKGHRKYMRAIILGVGMFARKNKTIFTKSGAYNNAVVLLSDLSCKGFQSATSILNHLDVSTADIQKQMLLSLPLSEKHSHDKEISLSEALEEIKISKALSGTKGMSKDHYCLGRDNKHKFEIYRIGKSLFGIRAKKNKPYEV